MNIKKIAFLIFALTFSTLSFAVQNEAKLVASASKGVKVGDRFRVVYELNANGSNFKSPNFGKLHRLAGPNTSQSSSIQIINGSYQQSVQQTYTYVITASEEGTYMISPASVNVDGETIRSNSLTIKVGKRSAKNSSAKAGNNTNAQNGTTNSGGKLNDSDVYLKTIISNKNPYLGEQIIITNRIYTKVAISNLSMDKSPSYEGFWSKSLGDDNNQLKQRNEIIDGQEYIVADISKYALFPQKSGRLTIKPTELKCVAQLQVQSKKRRSRDPFDDFFNDPFFNRNIKNVDVFLSSKEISVNVKPLPQEGKPESFTGAVGKFSFKAAIDHDTISTNDALNISVKLSGAGNLELINPPKINFPTDFETYDPKITNNISPSPSGVSGSKKIEYLAIARNPGDFVIKPLEFSYFNPADKKYHSISAGPYNINVQRGSSTVGGGISYSSSAQEDIKFIGKDIHHIKQTDVEFSKINDFLFGSITYYLAFLIPLILLLIIVVFIKQQRKRKGNTALMKTRKANKIAKSKLQKAEKLMKENNDKEFYNELAQALWGYLSDKFLIPQAELSIENITEVLASKQIDNQIIDGFVNALNNIDFARFAPGDAANKMKSIYQESLNAITLAEKAINNMKSVSKVLTVALFSLAIASGMANNYGQTMKDANQLYNQGLYDSCLVVYNSILSDNFQSAELYYNVGNANFKNGNIAEAILYYEKARKLSPNDEDIIYNLNICNSMIVDKIEKVPTLFYQQWWNYFYEMFNANAWAIISIVVWMLFIVALGFYILTETRSAKKLSFYLSILLFIAALGSFGLASQKYYYTKEDKEAIVFTQTLTVKSSPTSSSVDLFVVHEGTKVKILDKVDNWNKIKIQDGSIGWLPADAMKLI